MMTVKTNAEYWIDKHHADWRRAGKIVQCCGWAVDPTDHHCARMIKAGEDYLRINVYDINGAAIILCTECAGKKQ